MDKWKFFDITHREHVYCNPTSVEKFEQLIDLLRLRPGAKVLELASGKGEFLVRLAERYAVEGVGIDLSPYCIADAQQKRAGRAPDSQLTFLEMDGADYVSDAPESCDLVACLGASWIFAGHRRTLRALTAMAAPGGWVVVGEPFWRQEPQPEHLEAIGEKRDTYGSHEENAHAGKEFGLELAYTLVSSQDDWDRYEGLQWYAAEQWTALHPDDPDGPVLFQRVRQNKANYLKWERDTFGWAIYLFRKGTNGS